jgi:hypothetical protein
MSPLPLLNPAIIVDDALLAAVVDEFIHSDIADRDHREAIKALQTQLRSQVDDEQAWQLFLKLDETVTSRLADLSLAVARWAYLEGFRYGGGGRVGGDGK